MSDEMFANQEKRRVRFAWSFLVCAFLSPCVYLLQRIVERMLNPSAHPLMVLREVHTGYYWRAAGALWWAGLVSTVVFFFGIPRVPGNVIPSFQWGIALLCAGLMMYLAWRFP